MDKKRIQLIITSILVVIFIFTWARTFKFLKKKKTPKPSPAVSVPSLPTPAKISSTLSEVGVSLNKDKAKWEADRKLEWGRCPFSGKIYTVEKGEAVDLNLSGIIWDEERPLALINNRVVGIGDKIGISTVVDITQDRVILNDGRKNFHLKP